MPASLDVPSARSEADGSARHDFLVANYTLIRTVVHDIIRRSRLPVTEAQDFESWVWERFVDRGASIGRQFQGRASLSSYLRVVVRRWVLDYRTAKWGKWRPSARARRLGADAIAFERLVKRDGISAAPAARQLGLRTPPLTVTVSGTRRRRDEPLELAHDVAAPAEWSPGRRLEVQLRKKTVQALRRCLLDTLASLPPGDLELLHLRHAAGLTIAAISARVDIPAKTLYRTYERLHRELRRRLEACGFSCEDVTAIVGAPETRLEDVLRRVAQPAAGLDSLQRRRKAAAVVMFEDGARDEARPEPRVGEVVHDDAGIVVVGHGLGAELMRPPTAAIRSQEVIVA